MGHLGLWRCESCDRKRPDPDVVAREVMLTEDGVLMHLDVAGYAAEVRLPLAGLYSAYNALAAAAAAHALGLRGGLIAEALAAAAPAFGRQERFEIDGREVRMLLAKNPTGLNEVLRTVAASAEPHTVLAMLNDGIQDGRDVSWIYDADVELLATLDVTLVCSGDRADDLALRFALAGIEPLAVEPDAERALATALEATRSGDRIDIVPTYTAMLRMRELVARRAGDSPYWETGE
jgi:UDP-N-acetylmuramyl tripeptide synthase